MYPEEGETHDFEGADFMLGDDEHGSPKSMHKEGHYWKVTYQIKEGAKAPGPLELVKNFENAFAKKGGKLQWKQLDPSGGNATLSMPLPKGERWMQLDISNSGETYTETIIDTAAMEQKIELSADEMADQLTKNGFIALYGIQFDTGKDTIKPESEPILSEIVKLLQAHKDLNISVEGHTDNVGDKKANQTLSQKRADSVKKWLVGKSVDAKRLSTKGFGDSKPVADNRTEDGKAKNRRVELVKK
jgi:outer membrane protein OmpA-like peptidoglycan-associated protein